MDGCAKRHNSSGLVLVKAWQEVRIGEGLVSKVRIGEGFGEDVSLIYNVLYRLIMVE